MTRIQWRLSVWCVRIGSVVLYLNAVAMLKALVVESISSRKFYRAAVVCLLRLKPLIDGRFGGQLSAGVSGGKK